VRSRGGPAIGVNRSTTISSHSGARLSWLCFSMALIAGRSGVLAISPPSAELAAVDRGGREHRRQAGAGDDVPSAQPSR